MTEYQLVQMTMQADGRCYLRFMIFNFQDAQRIVANIVSDLRVKYPTANIEYGIGCGEVDVFLSPVITRKILNVIEQGDLTKYTPEQILLAAKCLLLGYSMRMIRDRTGIDMTVLNDMKRGNIFQNFMQDALYQLQMTGMTPKQSRVRLSGIDRV